VDTSAFHKRRGVACTTTIFANLFTNDLGCKLVAPGVVQHSTKGHVRTYKRCFPSKDLYEI
jgi:hypothetical protein